MLAKPFADPGGQTTYKNLIELKEGQPVGQWRDSDHGLGGGRYPYDVNTALMPAALHAIAELACAGAFENKEWEHEARQRAEAWETSTLKFFTVCLAPNLNDSDCFALTTVPQVEIPAQEAKKGLVNYTQTIAFTGQSNTDLIESDIHLHALALKADGSPVEIMHTDSGTAPHLYFPPPPNPPTAFRPLLLPHLIHSSNPSTALQHLHALSSLADSILHPFLAGLYAPIGVLIANPAYSLDPSHAQTFTPGAYHGTVVWSWNSLVLLAKGLEAQLTVFAGRRHHKGTR